MALGLPSRMPGGSATVRDLIDAGEKSFSFEFFPPKDEAGERQLWTALRELEALHPTFVSVTYGAGGSTRDRTVRLTERIAADTSMTPLAHLTCVDHSLETLRSVIGSYAAAGVRNVLALRGDPSAGPTAPYTPHPEGFHYAVELVRLVKSLGDFCVGVAAFPEGHPSAESLDADARVLAEKAQAGAEFAITQLFFRPDDYFRLADRVSALGVDIPIIPGIMPITNLAQIKRMAELSGAALPPETVERVARYGDDAVAVRKEGITIATELCDTLLSGGAPGLHFYTLNRSKATREIYANLRTAVG
ncbi:MAG TPA: methylenetetrahydrofolate reductase [NAD(P)H] [Nocardioidaceae bacterium]|nr:methylenetetrahydrofolate reductase [NAD(P)H] [Nocardioidaceae bacterium]